MTDEDGVPLPGATVLVEGTSTGVSTDFDGNYTIEAAAGQTLISLWLITAERCITAEEIQPREIDAHIF